MLRTETVEKGTVDLIKTLMTDEKFGSFNLVGGTALALKIGHRRSIDIDLFTTTDFKAPEIADHLSSAYKATRVQTINNGVFCFVNGIKLDLLAHKYPLLEEPEVVEKHSPGFFKRYRSYEIERNLWQRLPPQGFCRHVRPAGIFFVAGIIESQ